jgi:hypothetical protein
MSPFQQIEPSRASRSALGILMPPGRRTLVILRPRALDWDLVPLRPDGEPEQPTHFWEVNPEEGSGLVSELHRSLEEWAQGGLGRVEPVPAPGGVGYHVRIGVGRFVLLTCQRIPGVPYQPAVFDKVRDALAAAEGIAAVLCPDQNARQEIYFNIDHFRK